MSGGSRKRSSKWDLKEESRASYESQQNYSSRSGKADSSYHKTDGGDRSRWSNSEHRRASRADGLIGDEYGRTSKPMAWERDDNYGPRLSPGLDERRHRSRRPSPVKEWTRPRRSGSNSRSRSRSPVHSIRRDSGTSERSRSRSSVTAPLCKEFVAGRCRRGSQCQFIHQSAQLYEESWDGRKKTVSSRHYASNDSEEHPSGNGQNVDGRYLRHSSSDASGKGSKDDIGRERDLDRRQVTDKPCKFFASANCRNGNRCRYSHQVEAEVSPERMPRDDEKRLVDQDMDDREKTWDGPLWSDVDNYSTAAKSGRDGENPLNDGEYNKPNDLSDAGPTVEPWSVDSSRVQRLDGRAALDHQAPANLVESDRSETLKVKEDQSIQNDWEGDMEMSPEWNHGPANNLDSIAMEVPVLGDDATVAVQQSTHERPAIHSVYYSRKLGAREAKGLGINRSGTASNANRDGASPNALPILSSTNSVEQTQMGTLPDHSRGELAINPLNVDSGIPSSQNVVSDEQLSKLTDLSASLAQLLGQGQQLPQLYASHSSDHSNCDGEKDSADGGVQVAASNRSHEKVLQGTEEVPESDNPKPIAESGSKAKESKAREEKTDDEKGKGLRAFKFALVEFVKEALKPAWKEGQVSRDSYKNIVKKVVDKVTSTMQASSIPQTQEKIDQYLSSSKPKLTKLVQAYVEKFQKGK